MKRLLWAGLFFCCVSGGGLAWGQESPLAQFQAMVNQADSYSAAYRQYQSLDASLSTTTADEQNPTQEIFPGVSPSQWRVMGNTLRQRALAESSAFDAVLLLNLKQFKQSPYPERCRIDPQWLAVASSSVLSPEQSQLFGQLMALRQARQKKQPFSAINYAMEIRNLVEAYDHIGQPELAADTLIKGFSKLDKLQGKDRRGFDVLLSHRGSAPLLIETSLRLVAQLEPEELRSRALHAMRGLPPYKGRMAELVKIAGVPDPLSARWWFFAHDVATSGGFYLVEPAIIQILSRPNLDKVQRENLNYTLAKGYLIANDPQNSLAAYDRIISNSGAASAASSYYLDGLADYDKNAVYVQHVRQRINTETRPTYKAYLLFDYANKYIQAGQIDIGMDMYQQGLNILFKSNYHEINDAGGRIVDTLLYKRLIEQAERVNERFNTETITNGAGESFSLPLRKESAFAVAYARAGDFYRAQRLLLSAERSGSDNADDAIKLIDIYADAGEFALAERTAAWVNFDPDKHVIAWLHVANGYIKHGELGKAKARLSQVMNLLKHVKYEPFEEIAKAFAAIKELPPDLLAKAKKQNTASSLVDIARIYAKSELNNFALQVVAQINGLDDQITALRSLQFNKGTQLKLDDSGKAQLAKIIQQQFPLKEFWRQEQVQQGRKAQ